MPLYFPNQKGTGTCEKGLKKSLMSSATSKNTTTKSFWVMRLFETWKAHRTKKADTITIISRVSGELLFMAIDLNLG